MATVRISEELIRNAMQSEPVRAGLREVRDRKAAAAQAIIDAEGHDDVTLSTEDGTRPKGRPFSRVLSSDVEGEWGTSRVEQRRILGRAAQA